MPQPLFRASLVLFVSVLVAGLVTPVFASCSAPRNAIEAENCLPGAPSTQWQVSGAGDPTIQGFATDISFNVGGSVVFKINTNAPAYRLDIYRLGFYAGSGARLIASVNPSVPLPQSQPACLTDGASGLVDCGNWAPSASWAIPSSAVSGVYAARAIRLDTLKASMIVFIVRNDASHSDLVFQTSDPGWQAYNDGGSAYGASLYGCNGTYNTNCRAFKVSYNRPFFTRAFNPYSFLFNAEYPMIRWLESNGYDVSYISGVDTDRAGTMIPNHKVFLSVGHDEYWSGNQRANVEAARAAGVNLAFFSGDESFWKTRWESSIDGSNTPFRTLVCYKETLANAVIDPADPPTWTGTWRDPRFSPPADGGRPENALSGTIFWVDSIRNDSIVVPQDDGRMRFWRNTAAAALQPGQTYSTPAGTLGYEWDIDADNGARPAGLFHLSTNTLAIQGEYLLNFGSTFGNGTATHHLTLYRYQGKGLVFGAGTVQWPWGLDSSHDNGSTPADVNMQQATVNLLADMGAFPATLQTNLVAAQASLDVTPPTSIVTSPSNGAFIHVGVPITITGTAADLGGGVVGGVEVSVDGGITWHPAVGREIWSFSFTPASPASLIIKSRAADDSGNIEAPSAGVAVTALVPTSISIAPANPSVMVGSTVQLAATASYSDGSSQNVSAMSSWVSSNASIATVVAGGTVTGIRAGTATITATQNGVSGSTLATITSLSWTACPCTIWTPIEVPSTVDIGPDNPVELGVRFKADTNGFITGLHFYKSAGNSGTHVANLWSNSGTLLATATFSNESAAGWQQVNFASPVAILANNIYVASYHTNVGHFSVDRNYFVSAGVDSAPLHALANGVSGADGVYLYGSSSGFPINSFSASNYWVDVVMTQSSPATLTSITVSPLNPTITTAATQQFTATGHYSDGSVQDLSAQVSWISSNGTVATISAAGLATPHAAGNATITGTLGSVGGSTTLTVQAVTAPSCPCSIWGSGATPVTIDIGPDNPVELGVKFKADTSGFITGVRFYKAAGNAGTHVVNLWTVTGTLLATATVTNETASGWQQMNFSSSVAITAGTVYVASYHTNVGHFSVDRNYFATSGVDNAPLHALANGVSGANGVYLYGSASGFPVNSFSTSNYWVDVAMIQGTPPPLSSISVTPANSTIPAGGSQQFTATGSYSDGSTQNISGQVTWTSSNALAASVNSTGLVSGIATGTSTIKAALNSISGSTSVTVTAPSCPCSIWGSGATPVTIDIGPDNPVELGVKFKADMSGFITGVRFYKAAGNTGTHVVNLWTVTGTLLATATVTNETASGWQQMNFSSPVAITAGTVYVASYHTNVGHFSVDRNYFATSGVDNAPLHALATGVSGANGVYLYGSASGFPVNSFSTSNYWVDVSFHP